MRAVVRSVVIGLIYGLMNMSRLVRGFMRLSTRGGSIIDVDGGRASYVVKRAKKTFSTPSSDSDQRFVLYQRKGGKKDEPDEDRWLTVNLSDQKESLEADMDERIKEARRFESQALSDDDAAHLNKLLGIEKEILNAATNDDKDRGRSSSKKKIIGGRKRNEDDKMEIGLKSKMEELRDDTTSMRTLRGFLEINPFICSGCGSNFQSRTADTPGYLPPDKFKEHRLQGQFIRKKQEAIKILTMADVDLDSPAAERLLKEAGVEAAVIDGVKALGKTIAIQKQGPKEVDSRQKELLPRSLRKGRAEHVGLDEDEMFRRLGIMNDLSTDNNAQTFVRPTTKTTQPIKEEPAVERALVNEAESPNYDQSEVAPALEDEVCICQRCFKLQQYGQVDEILRPGWSNNELLTPERFEQLLSTIKDSESVVLCLVDVFDLHGSIIKNLRQIAGDNPVVIAVNKVDLLPKDISKIRVTNWIYSEVKRICGFIGPRDEENDWFSHRDSRKNETSAVLKMSHIHLVSCQNDFGLNQLMKDVISLAKDSGNKIYVMGAANVGKSSFINRLLGSQGAVTTGSRSNNQKNSKKPLVTVSNLPGTTLNFLKIKLPNGMTVIDTPGLINKGHLTSKLTIQELKKVIPAKPINAVTLRLEEGKCVLLGALARIELVEVSLIEDLLVKVLKIPSL